MWEQNWTAGMWLLEKGVVLWARVSDKALANSPKDVHLSEVLKLSDEMILPNYLVILVGASTYKEICTFFDLIMKIDGKQHRHADRHAQDDTGRSSKKHPFQTFRYSF